MKRLLVLLLLAGACKPVATVVDCSAEAASRLLDDVNTTLARDDWRQGLAGLVSRFGSCVVRKVVEQIAGDTLRAQHDEGYALTVRRAQMWLDEHPN